MSLKVGSTPTWFVDEQHQESGSVVSSTKNYDRFRFDPTQRPPEDKHVQEIMKALKEKNFLREYPIVVDVNFIVVDGQHRLLAAQALDLPVFYIISKSMTPQDVAGVNRNQKGWLMSDYLHSFCAQGKKDYLALQEFKKEYPFLSVSICRFLLGGHSQRGEKSFARGEFTVTQPEIAIKTANHLVELSKFTNLYVRWQFVAAVASLVSNPAYNPKRMIQKLEYMSSKLHRCVDTNEYLAMLSEIYNYRVSSDDVVSFEPLNKVKPKKNLTKRG
jgi:hypothetical protein